MDSNEVEYSVFNTKTLGNSTFVANHFSNSLSNSGTFDIGYMRDMFLFNEAYEPHFPHTDKFFVNIDEIVCLQVFF